MTSKRHMREQKAAEEKRQLRQARRDDMLTPGHSSKYKDKGIPPGHATAPNDNQAAIDRPADFASVAVNHTPSGLTSYNPDDTSSGKMTLITPAFAIGNNRVGFLGAIPLEPVPSHKGGYKQLFIAHSDNARENWMIMRYTGPIHNGKIIEEEKVVFHGAATERDIVRWLKEFSAKAELFTGKGLIALAGRRAPDKKLVTKDSELPQQRSYGPSYGEIAVTPP